MRDTASNAANVCNTTARPATCWYCLGSTVPARVPLPAQGIKAQMRAELSVGRWQGLDEVLTASAGEIGS